MNGMTRLLVLFALVTPGALLAAEPWVGGIQAPQFFAVSVEDVDKSVDWYRKAFGLSKLDDERADDDRWRIVNLTNDDLFVEIIRDSRDHARDRPRGFRKVGFRVPDVEVVADRMTEILGERPRVLDFPEHGARIIQLRDPDGNVIQLSSALAAPEPEHGE